MEEFFFICFLFFIGFDLFAYISINNTSYDSKKEKIKNIYKYFKQTNLYNSLNLENKASNLIFNTENIKFFLKTFTRDILSLAVVCFLHFNKRLNYKKTVSRNILISFIIILSLYLVPDICYSYFYFDYEDLKMLLFEYKPVFVLCFTISINFILRRGKKQNVSLKDLNAVKNCYFIDI